MNFTKSLKRFSQISIASILILSTSSCFDLGNKVDNTLAEFDEAINRLGNESANWRQVVKDLESSTKETISYELENFAQTTINTAGAEMRCNATFVNDYVGYEVQKKIIKKRNDLAQKIGASPRTVPAPIPVICNDPKEIILKGKQPQTSSVELYGYYLNPNDFQIIAHLNEQAARKANIENPGDPKVINKRLAGGQFKVSLNLGDNGISGNLLQIIDRISLRSQNQEIYSLHVIHTRAERTKAKVTVNFKSVDIEDDADPAGSAEVDFTFRVNGQTKTWRNSNADSGRSYSVNKQFQVTLSKEENLSIYVNGVDEDGGWLDEDDPLGQVTETFSASRNWGLGSHNMRSNCPDGCYYVNFDVNVEWIE
jgi:hypothetical protein